MGRGSAAGGQSDTLAGIAKNLGIVNYDQPDGRMDEWTGGWMEVRRDGGTENRLV